MRRLRILHRLSSHPLTPSPPMNHNHLRALWNLYTDLLISGHDADANTVRQAIAVAERNEIDAIGKY